MSFKLEEAQIAYKASSRQMEELSKSLPWQDIKSYLEEVIALYHFKLEQVQTIEEIKDLQGRISETRMFLEIPEVLAEDMKQYETKEVEKGVS